MICLGDGTGHFSPLPVEQFDRYKVRGLNSVSNVANAYDWNGDGLPDVIHQGWCPDENKQSGFIWLADRQGTFQRQLAYGGGSESATVITDWDGDGKKDILTTGFCENKQFTDHNYSTGRTFIVTQSAEQETEAPSAPADISIEEAGAGKVRFTWKPADGAPLSTTYELYLKTENGKLLGNCRAFTEGQWRGQRKVEEAGNRGTATTAVFALADGSYTIGVQAVDGRRQGSAFCTRQFTMTYCHPFTWQARNRTAKLLPKRTDSLETNSQRKQANYCQSPKKNSILN